KRMVIAYMSIGEAEDYRYYWQAEWKRGNPSWLDKENPKWKGNYKVKYWKSEWQEIIFDYLSRITNAGFDGVYLDIIDAFEYYEG
ncbi:MAG: endo alpha-1,4 polygalactosaminidase, partial [Bacteroidales bacterium]|nr:endo alpha-1,4 polygalactosaminidase [Bacteroidales bacterium]